MAVFKRKIYDKLLEWKNRSNGSTALLIEGARRIGKSTIAEELGKKEFPEYLIIDFSKASSSIIEVFDDGLVNMDDFFTNLFLSLGKPKPQIGSLIIFDEIQFCPKARQAIKSLVEDRRYYYIETGSLISIKENVKDILIPSEEERINMYPMDFEEFMWAIGKDYELGVINDAFNNRDTKVIFKNHNNFVKTLRMYMAIGGMPQAVNKFLETKDYYEVEIIKRNILKLYEDDIRKIDEKYGTICEMIWDQIASTLCHNNNRFKATYVNQRADSFMLQNSINKLKESKMVNIVYKVNEPKPGFKLTQDDSFYKIFYSDTGLFTSCIYAINDNESQDIYQRLILNKLDTNLGMLYENLACQILVANGYNPYYYSWYENMTTSNKKITKKMYEIDFLIYKKGKVLPIEIKSSKNKTTKSLDRFIDKYSSSTGEKYIVRNKPLEYGNNTTYIPFYMFHNVNKY